MIGGMSIELGTVGIWRHPSGLTPEVVAETEALGYGAIWVGGSPPGDLGIVEQRPPVRQDVADVRHLDVPPCTHSRTIAAAPRADQAINPA